MSSHRAAVVSSEPVLFRSISFVYVSYRDPVLIKFGILVGCSFWCKLEETLMAPVWKDNCPVVEKKFVAVCFLALHKIRRTVNKSHWERSPWN